MEKAQKTSATFTVLVEIFLGLITTKALDTSLWSYKNKSLLPINFLFLVSLVIVLVHSFSVFLQVSSQETYSEVLNQKVHRRRIICLLIGVIYVFVMLYLMADFFSGTTNQFLIISLLLALGWFAIDFNAAFLIRASYGNDGKAEAENDPLFVATNNWWLLDIILAIFFLVLLLSLHTGKLHEGEAAWAMLLVFLAAAIIVEMSLPRREKVTPLERESPPANDNP